MQYIMIQLKTLLIFNLHLYLIFLVSFFSYFDLILHVILLFFAIFTILFFISCCFHDFPIFI